MSRSRIKYVLLHFIYNLVFVVILPVLLLRLLIKSLRNKAYLSRFWQRFGIGYSKSKVATIWLHAASLGEAKTLIPLIENLLLKQEQIVVTTVTPTGAFVILKQYKHNPNVRHIFVPYDINLLINRFIKAVKPKQCIIIETEIWPGLIHACCKHKIKISLINGRLSTKSTASYKKLAWFFDPYLQYISIFCVQSKSDVDRFKALNIPDHKIHLTGNLKFDCVIGNYDKASITDYIDLQNRFVIVCASTHDNEEEIILDIFKELYQSFSNLNLLLVIVPRHPERFMSVEKLAFNKGFNTISKTALIAIDRAATTNTQVLIGNTLGELNLYYQLADLVFVGGSLVPIGGHNLLEPAAAAKPIVTGHHLHNFCDMSNQMLAVNGIVIANNTKELHDLLLQLIASKSMRDELANNAANFVRSNQGALAKTLELLEL